MDEEPQSKGQIETSNGSFTAIPPFKGVELETNEGNGVPLVCEAALTDFRSWG